MTAILGISAFYHDSAAALVVDGDIVAAAQEERFTRRKHDAGFPTQAIDYCLTTAGLTPDKLDYVGFYDKPLLKFDRLLETYLACVPAGFRSFVQAMPPWLRQKLHLPREIRRGLPGYEKRCVFVEHHESHAASAFFPSPFDEAAILTLDGVGEWATGSIGKGSGHRVELLQEMRFPHSPGLLYSAFTYYCGFEVNGGEHKLIGLAPYGEPRFADLISQRLIDLKPDGSFRLDLSYFNYLSGLTMTGPRFHRLFGGEPRGGREPITQRHMDLAASIQHVTGEIMLRCARHAHALSGSKNLCMAGGVALNCVGNARIQREGPFERVWIQPAAGDAGGALGTAQFIWHQLLGHARQPLPHDTQKGSLLGPAFSDDEIGRFLASVRAPHELVADDDALCDAVSGHLAAGKVVGWFQGRAEFGPRALGSRSILADPRPRKEDMKTLVNIKVKFRETFRPFAPAVLAEHAAQWFDMPPGSASPYMLLTVPVRDPQKLPGVTHVDGSARVQTVDERHGLFHRLLRHFRGPLLNTSFNLGWEPIVNTPQDAFHTFMSCGLDVLVMGHHIVTKPAPPEPPEVDALPTQPKPVDPLTLAVKAFYERTPFPNYDEHETLRSLIDKARRGRYAAALDRAIPHDAAVLEVGCGTGQLANYLGVASRRVIGTDICEASLQLAEAFRAKHNLERVRFMPMDLFNPIFAPASFDVVLCNGVLHHTADPRGGFMRLVPLIKPGGHIVIGLYNRFGRVTTDLRRALFRLTGNRPAWLDPAIRRGDVGPAQRAAWLADQYRHPHESKHTLGEVLSWFDAAGIEFVRAIPGATPDGSDIEGGTLFEPQPRGTPLDHLVTQLQQIGAPGSEGGYFIMIGRRP